MKAAVATAVAAGLAVLAVAHSRAIAKLLRDALQDACARRNRLALELMSARNRHMHSATSVAHGRSFRPRPTDVFVVTYPKCGTTWMTQIVHALRSHASMDFGEISEVCPWDILALDCKQDLDAEHVANPRVFKSHEAWGDVAKGGKYIYVARHPQDAFFSFFKFLPSFTGLQSGDLDQEAFAKAIFAGTSHSGLVWDHFLGWWEQRANPNVLWVFFEDLSADLRGEVARVARFLGIAADAALLDAVVRVSSFEFMSAKANLHHYDEHFTKSHVYQQMGIDANATQAVAKVNRGKVGARNKLAPDLKARLEAKWTAVLAGPTGCASYEALCEQVRQLNLI